MNYELEEIKKLRKKHNLTQTDLSKLANVSQSLIAKIESNNLDPSYSKVKKILDVLNNLSEKNEAKASDVMQRKIVFCEKGEVASEVIKKMRKHEISQIPVLEKNHVVGMVSETVILDRISEGKQISKMKVEDFMEDSPPLIPPKTPLASVIALLKFSPIVVVADSNGFAGVITKADILRKI